MPIVLSGEGDYSLTDVKDIKVTQEFEGLGEETTHCQSAEYMADCVTRQHGDKVLDICGCAPYYIHSHYKDQVC